MKAVRLNEWGKALELEDIPQPEPNDDEVLVRVHAASINPMDTAIQAGYLQFMAKTPLTLGCDFAGEVIAVGSNITHLKPGDSVYGTSPLGTGTFAEFTTVKAHEVTHKPQSMDYVASAAVPLPTMAAWKSLFELLEVKSGERLLIHGAAGNVGGELMERSYNVFKPGGRYVTSLLGETPQEEPQRRGIRSMELSAWPNADILAKMAEQIDSGKIHVFVNRTFPLEEVNAAMAYRLETKAPGKVVLTVL